MEQSNLHEQAENLDDTYVTQKIDKNHDFLPAKQFKEHKHKKFSAPFIEISDLRN